MDAQMPGDGELRQRLEAYAERHLRPDPLAMARVRAQVVTAATARGSVVPIRSRTRRWRLAGTLLAAAAAVLLIGGATAAASSPGGPLYGARLWVEAATLPSDPAARADAESQRLQIRLDEIATAIKTGDANALSAALKAYAGIVADTVPASDTEEHAAQLQEMLSEHLAVLNALLDTAPTKALPGLNRAITRSDQALQRLESETGGAGGTSPGQGGTSPGQGGTSPGQGGTSPGQGGTSPGQGGTAPDTGGSAPTPTPSKTPPGQGGTPSSQASTPPGHQDSPTPTKP